MKMNGIIHSSRGHDILLFLVFLLISFLFWTLLTLNNEGQKDIEIPIKLVNIPDSVTLINSLPESVNVSVRDKGSSLIQYTPGKTPSINLKFKDYNNGENRVVIGETELNSCLRSYFGNSAQLISIKPDSISVLYTTLPGKKVKVKLRTDIHPNFQYIISGPITSNIDSVYLYSVDELPQSLTCIETMPIVKSDLKDTTTLEVKITPLKDIRIIPNRISVTIPVEPLIAKKQTIPIVVENIPDGIGLITFPSKIDISYLLPISKYNMPSESPIKAFVDYNSITSTTSKVPVYMQYSQSDYRNLSFSPDSVEYIIEKIH